jgi:hypothetical protein
MIDDKMDPMHAPWGGMFPHPTLGLSTTPRRPSKAEMAAAFRELESPSQSRATVDSLHRTATTIS